MPRVPEDHPTALCLQSAKSTSQILGIQSRAFRLSTILLCVLFLVATYPASAIRAQSATATLSGTVVDPNRAVIPGVSIAVINLAQGFQRSATTNDQGTFVVPLLPPGKYIIKAQHDGFTTAEVRDVVLNVNDQMRLDIQLKVGDLAGQKVEIVDTPSLINESPAVGTIVNRQFVENIPLNGRSFQSLIGLTPGVVFTKANGSEQGQFSVNGQRANANYFTIDGVGANIASTGTSGLTQSESGSLPGFNAFGGTNNLVSVDAMEEFKVLTSTFSPEFGRTPGAQVQILTRSGTNDFHGTLFEYFRNDAMDANDWFANASRLRRPPLRQNDFGGVVGGPILLPRFGERGHQPWYDGHNRSFFFFSYEGLRLRQPQTAVTTVPSLNARLQASAQVPQIAPFLNAFPRPNGRDLANNFSEFNATFSNPTRLNATSIRIDHTINSKFTVFGRYNRAPSETVTRGGGRSLNFLQKRIINTTTITSGATLIVNSLISNDFRANYSSNLGANERELDSFGGAIPIPDRLAFPSFALGQNALFVFSLSGGTNASLSLGKSGETKQRQLNLVDAVSIMRTAHELKFGIDYRRLYPIFDPARYNQQVSFAGVNGALTATATSVFISGFEGGTRYPIIQNLSLFGQDRWSVSSRLSLTYGLRWEFNPPPSEKNGKDALRLGDLNNPSALTFVLPQGTPIYDTTHNSFAPRIGIAYELAKTKGREAIVRGGFGIFYDLGAGGVISGFGGSFPNLVAKSLRNLPFPLDPSAASAPAPPDLTPPINASSTTVLGIDPHLKLPYTYQWNASIEQSIGLNQSISASYVAAIGRRLIRQEAIVNPNPNFGILIVERNQATSDYHALQLQFQRHLSNGLQALASYTWSHSLDTASNDSGINPDITKVNLQQERGPSDFDVRHAVSGAITYDFPALFSRSLANVIVRNFSVDTIFTARSATPVNVITGEPTVGGIPGTDSASRPDLVPGTPLYINDSSLPGGKKINPQAFVIPTGRQGTLGRNALRGFPMWQVDLALRRQFHLGEKVRLQLRAEAFNLLNHPNFGDPGANFNGTNVLSNPKFGESISMLGRSLTFSAAGFSALYQIGGPRSLQMTLRLQF